MTTIQLPRLAGSRHAAGELLSATTGQRADAHIYVDCSQLRTGTASFAAAMVDELIVNGHARRVTFVAAPSSFADLVREAAKRRNVSSRIEFSQERLFA